MKKIITLLVIVIAITSCKDTPDFRKINKTLISVHKTDQQYRKQISSTSKKYGWNSGEMIALTKQINKQDSINTKIVSGIIDNYGWLGDSEIGEEANKTIFLVIQHSKHPIQEKYLPIMQKAVKKGNAKAKNLALLEDRVALGNLEKQIYGSQLTNNLKGETFLYPIANPKDVNKRRKAVGLNTIEEYLENFNLTWDVEKHKSTSETRMKEVEVISKLVVQ